MTPDLAPLLAHLEKSFNPIDQAMAELEDWVSPLESNVAGFARRADACFQEMVGLAHLLEPHERWLQKVARHLGLRLEL